MTPPTLKTLAAWLPIVLSLAMLAFILTLIAVYGIPEPDPNKDEGTAAHLFQLWLVLEVFLIALFAATWLPKAPKQASLILALQIFSVFAACFPVFYFEL